MWCRKYRNAFSTFSYLKNVLFSYTRTRPDLAAAQLTDKIGCPVLKAYTQARVSHEHLYNDLPGGSRASPGAYKSVITDISSETAGPMDSVLTLVNPSPPIHLEFDRNSVVNAILRKNSQPAYTIRTKQKTRSARTDVVDVGTQEVIASIEIKDLFPDVVTIADKTRVRVIETAYGRYLWKLHVVHRLALYAEGNLETPVAYLQPVTRTNPLVLIVESEAIVFIDQIIASFIIREKELRAKEKSSALAAGMLMADASPLMTGGGYAYTT